MNLRVLLSRLQDAQFVCTCCGCRYGDKAMAGEWLNSTGTCDICEKQGRVQPVDSYGDLQRGMKRVRVLAAGIFDERGILDLLGHPNYQPDERECPRRVA